MFEKYKFILASKSPRRNDLLKGLDIQFKVETCKDDHETIDEFLPKYMVPQTLAQHKSDSFSRKLKDDEILITADTLVFCPKVKRPYGIELTDNEDIRQMLEECEILGKPKDRDDALNILSKLSGNTHYVLTGVVLRSNKQTRTFTSTTEVTFKDLTISEIEYYLDTYKPYDKAGAYGVQEWIGYIAITSIKGSFYNVMGLPIQKLYTELQLMCKES